MCTPCSNINKKIIANNFVPSRGYTLQEVRSKLKLSKKLSDDTLVEVLRKYCDVSKSGRKYLLSVKPDATYIDCVRNKISANMGTFKSKFYTYNALSEVLYDKGLNQLSLPAEPELYKFFKKEARTDAEKIINGYNISKILAQDVANLQKSNNDTVIQKYLIRTSKGAMRHSTDLETSKIFTVLQSFKWGDGNVKYQKAIAEVNNNLLTNGEQYKGAIFNFSLKPTSLPIGKDEIDTQLRLHLYNSLYKKYKDNEDKYDPVTKQIINKWGRYQLGLGAGFSFVKNRKSLHKEIDDKPRYFEAGEINW